MKKHPIVEKLKALADKLPGAYFRYSQRGTPHVVFYNYSIAWFGRNRHYRIFWPYPNSPSKNKFDCKWQADVIKFFDDKLMLDYPDNEPGYILAGKATDKQKNFMIELGLDFDEDISKKQASELISAELKRRNNLPRAHGLYQGIGPGEMLFEHGKLVYCDDGNGNVWDWQDELNELEEF